MESLTSLKETSIQSLQQINSIKEIDTKQKLKRTYAKVKGLNILKLARSEKIQMLEKEKNALAKILNIDLMSDHHEILQMLNIFIQAPLDEGWEREENEENELIYYHKPTNIIKNVHPHIERLKYTITEVREFIEEIEKEKIGKLISSDVEYLQEISKTQKLNTTSLNLSTQVNPFQFNDSIKDISTTERKLDKTIKKKNEGQKLLDKGIFVTNTEVQGVSTAIPKNIAKFSHIKVLDLKTYFDKETDKKSRISNESSSLYDKEQYYKYSEKWYTKKYGFPLRKTPKELRYSLAFRSISIERVLQILYQMNLSPYDTNLFPVAILLDVLPLPPEIYELEEGHGNFMFRGNKLIGVFRPALSYIRSSLEMIKREPSYSQQIHQNDLKLIDKIGRPYAVNIERIYEEWLENPSKRNLINIGENNSNQDLFKDHTIASLVSNNNQILKDIMDKNYNIQGKDNMTSNMRDLHLIELIKQVDIDPVEEIHLMIVVEEFIKDKEQQGTEWVFRVNPSGKNYWIDHKKAVASLVYPFIEELKQKIEEFKNEIDQVLVGNTSLIKNQKVFENFFSDNFVAKEIIKEAKTQVLKILDQYISQKPGKKSNPNILQQKFTAILAEINKYSKATLNLADFIELIFFCDFDIEQLTLKTLKDQIERKEVTFLKNLNPDKEFLSKYKLLNPFARMGTRGSNHGTSYNRLGTNIFSTSGNSSYKRGSNRFRLNGNFENNYSSQFEELGPLADYMHLIDPELKNGTPQLINKGESLLNDLKKLGDLSNMVKQCQILIEEKGDFSERYLSRIIQKLNNLYNRLQIQKVEVPSVASLDEIDALIGLKEQVIQKRNKIMKSNLLFDEIQEKMISDKINHVTGDMEVVLHRSKRYSIDINSSQTEFQIQIDKIRSNSISNLNYVENRSSEKKECDHFENNPSLKKLDSNILATSERIESKCNIPERSRTQPEITNPHSSLPIIQNQESSILPTGPPQEKSSSLSLKQTLKIESSFDAVNRRSSGLESIGVAPSPLLVDLSGASDPVLPSVVLPLNGEVLDSKREANSAKKVVPERNLPPPSTAQKTTKKGQEMSDLGPKIDRAKEQPEVSMKEGTSGPRGENHTKKYTPVNKINSTHGKRIGAEEMQRPSDQKIEEGKNQLLRMKDMTKEEKEIEIDRIKRLRTRISIEDMFNSSTDTKIHKQNRNQTLNPNKPHDSHHNQSKYITQNDFVEWFGPVLTKDDAFKKKNFRLEINNILKDFLPQFKVDKISEYQDEEEIGFKAYARSNNTLPFRIHKSEFLRAAIQVFMLEWLEDKFELTKIEIENLKSDPINRRNFFEVHNQYFGMLVDYIMKNPLLSKKALQFMFGKHIKERVPLPASTKSKGKLKLPTLNPFLLKSSLSKHKDLSKTARPPQNLMRTVTLEFPSKIEDCKTSRTYLRGKNSTMRKTTKRTRLLLSPLVGSARNSKLDRRMDVYVGQSNINSCTFDLIKKYGSPSTINRSALLQFNNPPLYLSSTDMILEVSGFLGIGMKGIFDSEPDLVWVAIFTVLHYNQSIDLKAEKKDWVQDLQFFFQVLQHQRNKKKVFFQGMKKKDRLNIIKAISWVAFWNKDNDIRVFFNFANHVYEEEISEEDLVLYRKYYDYGNH